MKTAARGYGSAHQKRRKREARRVAAGTVVCWRCNQLILPDAAWDLGHDDKDRTVYRGPEHAACNRATASHRPSRKRPEAEHPGLCPLSDQGEGSRTPPSS
jgi:hypothetical protein